MRIGSRRGPESRPRVPGEHVEAVQLQVVCSSLWRSLPEGTVEITVDQLREFGDVTDALARFYDDTVAETSQRTEVSVPYLRMWFEERLITPAQTRSMAYHGRESTAKLRIQRSTSSRTGTWCEPRRRPAPLVRADPRPLHGPHPQLQRPVLRR